MRRYSFWLLLVSCVVISSCSSNNLLEHPSPWTDGQISVTSMGGAVVLGHPDQDLVIFLDKAHLPATQEVVVTATELYSSYLIETSDPNGRFLPSIRVVEKEPRPLLSVQSLQVEKGIGWKINSMGELEILPMTRTSLGISTLRDLPVTLQSHMGSSDVNILLPVGGTFVDSEEYEVFQTLGEMTVILLPLNFAGSSSSGLTAPTVVEGIPWFSISTNVGTLQTTAISEMIRLSSSASLF